MESRENDDLALAAIVLVVLALALAVRVAELERRIEVLDRATHP